MLRNTVFIFIGLAFAAGPAFAQQQQDPNLKHFYKARQEWQYVDESPIITGHPGVPGVIPTGPAPLPRANWQEYSQSLPGKRTDLPVVNNGVPPKEPPAPIAKRASASKLKAPVHSHPMVQSYKPYQGYSPGAQSSAGMQTSSQVKGSLLHWARNTKRSY